MNFSFEYVLGLVMIKGGVENLMLGALAIWVSDVQIAFVENLFTCQIPPPPPTQVKPN